MYIYMYNVIALNVEHNTYIYDYAMCKQYCYVYILFRIFAMAIVKLKVDHVCCHTNTCNQNGS